MGTVLQLLGFALIVVWAKLCFGFGWACLVAGLVLLVLSLAVGDAKLPRPRRVTWRSLRVWRRREQP